MRNHRRLAKLICVCFGVSLYFVTMSLFPNIYEWSTNTVGDTLMPFPKSFPIIEKLTTKPKGETKNLAQKSIDIKYILKMTRRTPLDHLKEGRATFIQNKCEFQNCYLISNDSNVKSVSTFQALLFGSPDLKFDLNKISKRRLNTQMYIFASTQSADYCRAMDPKYDNFFSWTWTYRLDSDILWRHFRIYDMKGDIVGPARKLKWLPRKKMKPTPNSLLNLIQGKRKAAAFFSSRCNTFGRREEYVSNLIPELRQYGWSVDSFGACGNNSCRNPSSCREMLQKEYFFYLSFESSIEEDYVTGKLLNALNNFIVPIVYGGADYGRFLPPGSYLNARKLDPKKLAKLMNNIILNSTRYKDFFKWNSHYRYEPSLQSETCNLCAALNDKKLLQKKTLRKDFRSWWNGAMTQTIYDFLSQIIPIDNVLSNLTKNYNFTHQYGQVWFEAFRKRINVPTFVDFLSQNVEEQIKERDEKDNLLRSVVDLTTPEPTVETDFYTSETTTQDIVEDD